MKHPVSVLMHSLLGSANSIVVHRAVIRAFRDADAPSALETAALWEHLVYLQAQQGEWVILPQAEMEDALFIPERTARRLIGWLKEAGLVETRRYIAVYQGQSGNFQQYRPNMEALAALLGYTMPEGGTGRFEGADLAGSKTSNLAGSTITSEKEKGGREDAPRSSSKRGVSSEEKKQGKVKGNTGSGAARNPVFDAIVAQLYPQGAASNAGLIAKVSQELTAGGWTGEDVTRVLVWRAKDAWWSKKLTLPSFQKYAEDWKRESGVAKRAPVVSESDDEDVTLGMFS